MYNLFYVIIIIVVLVLTQAIWIFIDAKKRNEKYYWLWGLFGLLNVPSSLIIYLIVTRAFGDKNKKISCPKCKRQISESSKCCPYCGFVIKSVCPNCGSTINTNWKYCPNCSFDIQKISSSVTFSDEDKKPSRWNYVLATIILCLGITGFVLLLCNNITGMINNCERIIVPSKSEIELNHAGKYIIFYEYESFINGKKYRTPDWKQDFKFEITDTSTGSNVKLKPRHSSNYSLGGKYNAKSLYEFDIEQPGKYEFNSWYDKDNEDMKAVIAVNYNFTQNIILTILEGFVILFVTIGLFVLIIVRTLKRRKQNSIY